MSNSKTPYTNEQLNAITSRNCDILVSAAAGSGKTAVLTERIVGLITDKKNPIDIDSLLVVTFTEAAASEMRRRIGDAIIKKLNEAPKNSHLQRQIALLNKSSITTIHSFCLSVIRKNSHLIDIDPNFRIADETEIKLLQSEIMDELFEELYMDSSGNNFEELVESYAGNLTDRSLSELFLEIYTFIQSSPRPTSWLREKTEMFNIDDAAQIEDTVWGGIIKKALQSELHGVSDSVMQCLDLLKSGTCSGYEAALYNDLDIVHNLLTALQNSPLDALYNKFPEKFKFAQMRTSKNDTLSDTIKDEIKAIREENIKKKLNNLSKNIFFKNPAELIADIKNLYPILKTLSDTIIKFDEKFKAAKREKLLCDFNDLEHFCLDILLDENNNPSVAAMELREKYNEIMIDEYQDSNLVQEYILMAVSRESPDTPNRFMVGDIKQCIYKFRLARPDLFMQKYNEYQTENGSPKKRINLSRNFRSRKNIINAVNFLFRSLMSPDIGEISYDENASLHFGAAFTEPSENENISEDVEIYVLESKTNDDSDEYSEYEEEINELSGLEMEASFIANRIKKLFEEDFMVFDGGKYRPVEYRDIVILLRSIKTAASVFSDVLTANGIPSFSPSPSGYWGSIEVMTILSFLQIIDNERQDIHLITVLCSPIYGLLNDELAEIRLCSLGGSRLEPAAPFYDCILYYISPENKNNACKSIKSKLLSFLNQLSYYKKLSIYTPTPELLWTIYENTNYFNYTGMLTGGLIRQGNLRALAEKAIQYEKTSFKGLFSFIKYIERLEKTNNDFGDAKILSENENLVRIMSIHKSKGLEFPVVFVGTLGKKFNLTDMSKNVLLHQDLGFGPNYIDTSLRLKFNSIPRLALSKIMKQETLSEELRVLYVALTRAKEKLILTGAVKDIGKKIRKWTSHASSPDIQIPPHYLLSNINFLDWILPVLVRHRSGRPLREYGGISEGAPNKILYNDPSVFTVSFVSRNDLVIAEREKNDRNVFLLDKLLKISASDKNYSGKKDEIYKRLSFMYRYELEKSIPSKVSVSEIKRHYYIKDEELETIKNTDIIFETPKFIKEKTEPTYAEKGTILHTFLEHMDINNMKTRAHIYTHIDNLIRKNIMTKNEADTLNIQSIELFLNSDLAERMRKSKNLKREIPFVLSISPYEVYNDIKYKDLNTPVLLHGIIDCYFEENGGIVLLDYKSDFVKNGGSSIEAIKNKYKMQISFYKKAVENSTCLTVKESILYLFSINREIIL